MPRMRSPYDPVLIEVNGVDIVNIYKPYQLHRNATNLETKGKGSPRYGLGLCGGQKEFVVPLSLNGSVKALLYRNGISSQQSPLVLDADAQEHPNGLQYLRACADAANLPIDRCFVGTYVQAYVTPYEIPDFRGDLGTPEHRHIGVGLQAVMVSSQTGLQVMKDHIAENTNFDPALFQQHGGLRNAIAS